MNSFPYIYLKQDVFTPGEKRETCLAQFKKVVKNWLQVNKLSFAWLADNLGKSEGTVKNWFYTSVNVDDEKLERIIYICKAHMEGGSGVIYAGAYTAEALGFIKVEPSWPDHIPDPTFNDIGKQTAKYCVCDPCPHDKWCMAAGVPENTLSASKSLHYLKLARWVTETLMGRTRETLLKARNEGVLNLNAETDGDCGVDDVRHNNTFSAGVYEDPDGDSYPYDVCFYLPVLRQDWRSDYLRLAAGLNGYPLTAQWVIACLNEEADKQRADDLAAFLGEA